MLAHTLDYQTLGLQEDFYRGHEITVKVYPVLTALGSSRDLLGVQAGALYAVPILDGVAVAYVESITEMEPDRLADASIEGGVHLATPSFKVARLVLDARVLDRYRNYLRKQTTLGGDKRLRGYATGAFFGEDALVANAELRSKPLELATVQAGMALFYDVGDAFDGFATARQESVAWGELDLTALDAPGSAPTGLPAARDGAGRRLPGPVRRGFPATSSYFGATGFARRRCPARGNCRLTDRFRAEERSPRNTETGEVISSSVYPF